MRCIPLAVLIALLATPAMSQGLGARQQWQPELTQSGLDPDRRLAQPVDIEILGRAAVPALELLLEKTGVSLGVAPEDLTTVGERKLTVIARDCSLKTIMVQIPEALQECHWDVDRSGEEPAYLLHRDSGADDLIQWLEQRAAEKAADEKRAVRLNRMAEARKALAMSPAALVELEKSDPMLAKSVRDPHSRDMLEILLTLPAEQMQQFQDTGHVTCDYAQASARLQQTMQRIAKWYVQRWAGEQLPEEVVKWRDHLSHATISVEDNGTEHGWGVWLAVDFPVKQSQGNIRIHDVAVQPRYPNLDEGQPCFTRLLVATGTPDEETAFQITMDMDRQAFRTEAAKQEGRRKREWREPTDPDLLQPIALGDQQFPGFPELQKFIAEKTGLSVISDSFTGQLPYLGDEMRKEMPLWRLLYMLGEESFGATVYPWKKVGKTLVFHRADWYALTKREVPESFILAYRDRLQKQGELTLDDLAEAAVALESRDLLSANLPDDLRRAGLGPGLSYNAWALLLYASLSPEQKPRLRTAEGLAFADMTIAQRQQVIEQARSGEPPTDADQAARAVFRLVESTRGTPGRQLRMTELLLEFADRADRAIVQVRRIEQAAPGGGGAPR